MIKRVNNVNILLITESKWKEWSKENKELTNVECTLCSYTIQKIWIERSVYVQVTNDVDVMRVIFAHLDAKSFDTLDVI